MSPLAEKSAGLEKFGSARGGMCAIREQLGIVLRSFLGTARCHGSACGTGQRVEASGSKSERKLESFQGGSGLIAFEKHLSEKLASGNDRSGCYRKFLGRVFPVGGSAHLTQGVFAFS